MSDPGYVDVLGDDSLFRRGRVVDVSDKGLFIDFCSNRRHEFTPFNRIFQVEKSMNDEDRLAYACAYGKPDGTIPIDALMRATPSGPWTWLPAGIINVARGIRHERCRAALVQWVQEERRTDLVPVERLRWRVASDWWATENRVTPAQLPSSDNWHDYYGNHGLATRPEPVEPGLFEKRTMPLPDDCRHVNLDKLLQQLNGKALRQTAPDNCAVSFVGIKDGTVSYIWRCLPKIQYQDEYYLDLALYESRECHEALTSRIRNITWMLTEESAFAEELEESDNVRLLSSAVLLEVFSHLDTRTQSSLRAVCFGWNAILELPVLTACIVVTRPENSDASTRDKLHYSLMAPVFNCLRPSTQDIVVDARKSSMDTGDFLTLTDMIHYVGHKIGCRLRAIHVVGLDIKVQLGNRMVSEDHVSAKCELHGNNADQFSGFDPLSYRLVDFIAACSGLPCDAMHLVKCTFDWDYFKVDEWRTIQLSVDLRNVWVSLSGEVGSAMWDALEKCVPMPRKTELDALSTWLASVIADEGKDFERELSCNALCATQSIDPRPPSHYRGKEWCVDGLNGLQLEKLSPIALDFLVDLMDYFDELEDHDTDNYCGGAYYRSDDEFEDY
ncbi:uncharacterized protein LOC129595790 [Paramacrobiotus metropolitanus]|uniref:uncharacterized protein LOC129595790 n=1 Tax=Paramacrobiotus metropolitanus TaxID=2943436 RepID=UPI0024461D9B|nr:uncharacterized protein LOC129595790 [Paramacrobiotus metropolitanus]